MTTATATMTARFFSGPDVAEKCEMRIDRFRKILGRRPDLKAMFQQVGPLRMLPAERLEEFRAALSGPSSVAQPAT